MRLFIPILILFVSSLFSTSLSAHEGHSSAHAHAFEHESTQKLVQFLKTHRGDTDAEVRAAGELLLAAVADEVFEELRHESSPSLTIKVARGFKEFVFHFSPYRIGKWLFQVAREHGPGLAVACGLSEVLEQGTLLYSLKHPEFLFLLPISLSHVGDAAVFGLWFGLPRMLRAAKLWNRGYFGHLLEQRKLLPFDLNAIVDIAQVDEISFAILEQNYFDRWVPRQVKILLNPRKLAQIESTPSITLKELEKIARESSLELNLLKEFKSDKPTYAALLMRELTRNEKALTALRNKFKQADVIAPALKFVFENALNATVTELRQLGESPDLIAQRVLWGFERQYGKSVESSDRGLAKIAATRYQGATIEDWQHLHIAIEKTYGTLLYKDYSKDCAVLLGSSEKKFH